MRRLSLVWVVSLLLILAQHGALLHQLGHFSRHADWAGGTAGAISSATTLVADLQALDGGPCLTCEAFAQIANPAAPHAAAIDASPAAVPAPPAPCYSVAACDTPTPRSRGPPQV